MAAEQVTGTGVQGRMAGCKYGSWLIALLALGWVASSGRCGEGVWAAPLVELREVEAADGTPAQLLRGLGPVVAMVRREDGQELAAVRPLWARANDPSEAYALQDVLWPLAVWRVSGAELHARLALLFRNDRDTADPESPCHTVLLPLFFRGIAEDGERYQALFPLSGSVRGLMGMDEVEFWFFPLYVRTRDGRMEGIHFMMPLVARIEGPGVRKRRVFPFWGMAEKAGKWRSRFVCWPFWYEGRSLDPERPAKAWMLLPVLGRIRQGVPEGPYLRSDSVLWPFFSYTRTADRRQLRAPWPFFRQDRRQNGDGEFETTALHLWPVWGWRREGGERSCYAVWPLTHWTRSEGPEGTQERLYVLPFYWSFRYLDGGRRSEYQRLWPLASLSREGEREVLRVLDLWPQRHAPAVDRNWAPFWTVYSRVRWEDEAGGGERHDAFWGLWQREREAGLRRDALFPLFARKVTEQGSRTDLLTGLVGWERDGEVRRWRWCWGVQPPWRWRARGVLGRLRRDRDGTDRTEDVE